MHFWLNSKVAVIFFHLASDEFLTWLIIIQVRMPSMGVCYERTITWSPIYGRICSVILWNWLLYIFHIDKCISWFRLAYSIQFDKTTAGVLFDGLDSFSWRRLASGQVSLFVLWSSWVACHAQSQPAKLLPEMTRKMCKLEFSHKFMDVSFRITQKNDALMLDQHNYRYLLDMQLTMNKKHTNDKRKMGMCVFCSAKVLYWLDLVGSFWVGP